MSGPKPNYRVYCLDGLNRVLTADWVDARSDDEALAAVRSRYNQVQLELWDDRRLVAALAPDQVSA